MTTEMTPGTSKTDITPPLPVMPGGFEYRFKEAAMHLSEEHINV
ncbi:hypothetical protein [Morganella psychrotolerans]|nr:hypothetical protein [Morganella psychrotolerans]